MKRSNTKKDKRLDDPYTQVLSNDSDEALNPYFRGCDSRTSTSKPISPGDILKHYILILNVRLFMSSTKLNTTKMDEILNRRIDS